MEAERSLAFTGNETGATSHNCRMKPLLPASIYTEWLQFINFFYLSECIIDQRGSYKYRRIGTNTNTDQQSEREALYGSTTEEKDGKQYNEYR